MTGPVDIRPDSSVPEPAPRSGLRPRIWVGCLGGTIAGGIAWWALVSRLMGGTPHATGDLMIGLAAVFALSLITGVVLAAWLDRGIVSRVRDLHRSVSSGRWVDRPGRPWISAWGELAALAGELEPSLARQRELGWAADELTRLRRQIEALEGAIERWTVSERWEPLAAEETALSPALDALNRGFDRQRTVTAQNLEAARQMKSDLAACLIEAREAAEQAEHGFVEATATLTSLNDLRRLATELEAALAKPEEASADRAAASETLRAAAASAIEELVAGARDSIDHLADGFSLVREIGEQVHVLSNRATMIALNTLLPPADATAETRERGAADIRQLALEVRSATTRVAELSRELERETEAATARMRGISERVALQLDRAPVVPATIRSGPNQEVARLLERLRDAAGDVGEKRETFSKAAERASSAAQSVVQQLDDQGLDMEGLVVRLSPPESGPEKQP